MNNRGERKHTDLLTLKQQDGQINMRFIFFQGVLALIPPGLDADCISFGTVEQTCDVKIIKRHAMFFYVCRRHGVQAEGLPGLHSLSAAERRHPGPGGEGEDHARGPTRLPGSLQQLRLVLPEPGPLRGESQRLPLRLRPVGVHRSLLQHR